MKRKVLTTVIAVLVIGLALGCPSPAVNKPPPYTPAPVLGKGEVYFAHLKIRDLYTVAGTNSPLWEKTGNVVDSPNARVYGSPHTTGGVLKTATFRKDDRCVLKSPKQKKRRIRKERS